MSCPCPNCGYCPSCGRSNAGPRYPYQQPYYPWYNQPQWWSQYQAGQTVGLGQGTGQAMPQQASFSAMSQTLQGNLNNVGAMCAS